MLNEYVYCPRLAYMMWVQGEFAHNTDTVEGAIRHSVWITGRCSARKRREHGKDPRPLGASEFGTARLTARIDLVEGGQMGTTNRLQEG